MNLEKYTERARGFVQAAQSLALREGHQQFATEHLLKVLLDDEEGLAAGLIDRAGGNSREALRQVEQGLAKLVLGLIELLHQLLERQAIRRMEGGTLTDQQVEDMGLALMKLEEKIREIAQQFGLKPEDLNLNLGPLGNLLE